MVSEHRALQSALPCLCFRSLRVPLEGLAGGLGPRRAGALGGILGGPLGAALRTPQDLPGPPGSHPLRSAGRGRLVHRPPHGGHQGTGLGQQLVP